MMFNYKYSRFFWLSSLCLLALILMLPGCSFNVAGTSGPPVDGSPKGPGSANLTATALATPISIRCPNISVVAASTSGWQIYKDTHFPFQVAIPPGWRAGSFVDNGNDYIVQVFPPGSTTPVGQAGLIDQEHFSITIALSDPTSTYANDSNWRAEAGSIPISGIKIMIYDRTTPDCGEVNRGANVDFGHHHFTFYMISIPGRAKNDIGLFLGMLESFVYRG